MPNLMEFGGRFPSLEYSCSSDVVSVVVDVEVDVVVLFLSSLKCMVASATELRPRFNSVSFAYRLSCCVPTFLLHSGNRFSHGGTTISSIELIR